MTTRYYANKVFTIAVGEVVRLVFLDEQSSPRQTDEVANIIMSVENTRQLRDLLNRLLPIERVADISQGAANALVKNDPASS